MHTQITIEIADTGHTKCCLSLYFMLHLIQEVPEWVYALLCCKTVKAWLVSPGLGYLLTDHSSGCSAWRPQLVSSPQRWLGIFENDLVPLLALTIFKHSMDNVLTNLPIISAFPGPGAWLSPKRFSILVISGYFGQDKKALIRVF